MDAIITIAAPVAVGTCLIALAYIAFFLKSGEGEMKLTQCPRCKKWSRK